jgi:hypothetical protein
MAGTLTVYHRPMRPITVKCCNYTISTIIENIHSKYKSPNDKQYSQNVVMKRGQSQFSIICDLASQYRLHSGLLTSAVHCPRCFLSMGSHSGQRSLRLSDLQPWHSGIAT